MIKPRITRDITDSITGTKSFGHKELWTGIEWKRQLHSEWIRYETPVWLKGGPLERMRYIGIETDFKSARSFEDAADCDFDALYYLAMAAENGVGAEALKWIMSIVITELKVREKPFNERSLSALLPALVLNRFLLTIKEGKLDRTFAKPAFSELIEFDFTPGYDGAIEIDNQLLDPRFIVESDDINDKLIEQIIKSNPEQVKRAKENPKILQWFVGQVMKESKGKARPSIVMEKLTVLL